VEGSLPDFDAKNIHQWVEVGDKFWSRMRLKACAAKPFAVIKTRFGPGARPSGATALKNQADAFMESAA